MSELQQLATTLLTDVTHYTLRGNAPAGVSENSRAAIMTTAQAIINLVRCDTHLEPMDDCVKIGEMVAKQMFAAFGAFQQIPPEGVFLNHHPTGDLTQVMFTHRLVSYAKLADYFRQYGRSEPRGPTPVPFSFACGQPEKTIWDVAYQDPETKRVFMRAMTAMGAVSPVCGLYDFSWVVEASKVDDGRRMLLVDVGGGNGHATRSIASSGLPLQRCVLQDKEPVINEVKQAGEMCGVKLMAIDMHKEQPVKGAYVYYIRYCLHDYSDEAAIAILGVIADAMAGDSRLLIAEQVLNDPPSAPAASLDLLMLTVGGKERTEEMWRDVGNARDWKSLCLVSRSAYGFVAPLLFARIVLHHGELFLGGTNARIQSLYDVESTSFLQYTKHLRIVSRFRRYISDYRCPHFASLDGDFMNEEESRAGASSFRDPMSNIGQLLCRLREARLESFSWEVGTCLPEGVFWPLGYLPQAQNGLESISLITDGSCGISLRAGNPLVLDVFPKLRRLSWVGIRSRDDMQSVKSLLLRNHSIVSELELDAVRYDDSWASIAGDAVEYNVVADFMLPSPSQPEYRQLTALRRLSLGAVPLRPATDRVAAVLCLDQLQSLRLRACPGWTHLFRYWLTSGLGINLALLEIQVSLDMFAGAFPERMLVTFLEHFEGLEELYISIPGLLDRPTALWHAALGHPKLRRFVYHVRIFDLDLESMYAEQDASQPPLLDTIGDIVLGQKPPAAPPTNLECLGVTCFPLYLEMLVRSLRQHTSLKVLHVRQSGRDILRYDSWGLRMVEEVEDLWAYEDHDGGSASDPSTLARSIVFGVPGEDGRGPHGYVDIRSITGPCRLLQPEFQRFAE
ncbi:Methyltransferase fsa4 [Colletotrichum aenigma]|uniref:Methyltransferase fsa4 n=1 Tax=Colletotrichum aenigma TaxID=1215731 RepID=UPI00187268B8|nr:Methyltransferase fsa4 [Colletotrichum aenigma]KAF5520983.1 Methyltransferase fsa4 [Colletotrichum aenigma]